MARLDDQDILRVEWEAIHRAERDEIARAHGYFNAPDYELQPLDDWASDAYGASKCKLCGQIHDAHEKPAKHNRFHYSKREGGHCAYVNRSPIG